MIEKKLARLLAMINEHREEITEITPSVDADEYYFKFRFKFFSVSKGRNSAFFAYPKWAGTISLLMTAGNDTADANFVYITRSDSANLIGYDVVTELYDWLDAKNSGVDKLFADLGID